MLKTRVRPCRIVAIAASMILGTVAVGTAQENLEERVRALEEENSMFRSELEALREGGVSSGDQPTGFLSRASKHIRMYGFLRLDAYQQTARANSVIIPAFVYPEGGTIGDNTFDGGDDGFALDARLTRFGFDIDFGEIAGVDVDGRLEADFANFPAGVPESRATPRIRLAYTDFNWDSFRLRTGQDWDVMSPLYPAVHSELLLWFAGNLGDRRPQVQGTWMISESDSSRFQIEAALGLTGAVDNQDLDGLSVGSERDGFDFGLPHLQMRAGVQLSESEGSTTDIGLWGLIGGLETDGEFNGEDSFTTWSIGLDATLPLTDAISLRGEQWYGQALSDVRGNIGQSINTASGDEIRGWGGFGEVWYQASEDLRFHVGGSYDNPSDGDLLADRDDASAIRTQNWTAYIGTVKTWEGGMKTGFDMIYWQTDWEEEGEGDMLRFNAYVQLSF